MTKLNVRRIVPLLLGGVIGLLAGAIAHAQSITVKPLPLTANEGTVFVTNGSNRIYVTAGSMSSRTITYQWYKVGSNVPITPYPLTGVYGQTLYFNIGYVVGLGLKPRPVQYTDNGNYYCVVRYYDNTSSSYDPLAANNTFTNTLTSDTVKLTVNQATLAPAKLTFKAPNTGAGGTKLFPDGSISTFVIGTNFNLTAYDSANAGGYATSVRWFRNGVELTPSTSGFQLNDFGWTTGSPSLQLAASNTPSSTNPNGDEYYCLVKNSIGNEIESGRIRLIAVSSSTPPSILAINSQAWTGDYTTIIKDTMFIGSKMDFLGVSALNTTSIEWKKGSDATVLSTGSTYAPTTGWASADAGTYYFTLKNGSMTVQSNPIQIAVVDGKGITVANPIGKTVLTEGVDTVTLVSSAAGVKISGYKWFLNGVEIRLGQTGSTLKSIYPVAITDTGNYTYRAYNEVDSATSGPIHVSITRELFPLFVNLNNTYLTTDNSPRLALKGIGSETLTNWSFVNLANPGNPLIPYADIYGVLTLRTSPSSKLDVGRYRVKATNADKTLQIEKVVEIK